MAFIGSPQYSSKDSYWYSNYSQISKLTTLQVKRLLNMFKKRKFLSQKYFIELQNQEIDKILDSKTPNKETRKILMAQKINNAKYLKDLRNFLTSAIDNKVHLIKDIGTYQKQLKILEEEFFHFQVKYSIVEILREQ